MLYTCERHVKQTENRVSQKQVAGVALHCAKKMRSSLGGFYRSTFNAKNALEPKRVIISDRLRSQSDIYLVTCGL